MKKIGWTICTYLACAAGAVALAAGSLCLKIEANAENNGQETLLAPSTYQQFLALENPTDVAVCEDYTAIADGNVIYIYDAAENCYTQFTHEVDGQSDIQNVVQCLGYSASGKLYYADSSSGDNFYQYNPEGEPIKISAIACNTFVIDGETLYFSSAAQVLHTTTLTDHNASKVSLGVAAANTSLAFWKNELYFMYHGAVPTLCKIKPEMGLTTLKQVATFPSPIAHIAIADDVLACTGADGTFYAYNLPSASETLLQVSDKTYTALAAYGEYVYAVCEDSIRQFSTREHAFTPFEICQTSARENRLNGATEVLLVGDTLWIADVGNGRMSAYNTKTNAFIQTLDTDMVPLFLAGDGQTLLLANQTEARVYNVAQEGFGSLLGSFTFESPLVGATNVYGKYYLTANNHFVHSLTKNEAGEYQLSTVEKAAAGFTPSLLTSDVHGNLYVLCGTKVLRFNESQFMSALDEGQEVATIEGEVQKLAVDFNRNVYTLSAGQLAAVGGSAIPFDTCVYTPTVTLTSFAFGVEENATYLLVNGNHLVKSTRLNLPTMQTIAVNGADAPIFDAQSAPVQAVNVHTQSLLVQFNLNQLNGATYFPYVGYTRNSEAWTALKLGETAQYNLIAFFDEIAGVYNTYLVEKTSCTPLQNEEFLVAYDQGKTAWLSNDVHLYKFPYLTTLLTVDALPRGGQVTLLGEVNGLDNDYYLVSYTNENGETMQGYLPQSYAALYDAVTSPTTQTTVGETEKDADSVMRLIYLLLGFLVICILVDFLLLRKKEEE